MRARFRSVGTTRPVSSCERKLAESPVWRPSSTSPIDFFSRRCLIRSPMRFSAINDSAASPSTWMLRRSFASLPERTSVGPGEISEEARMVGEGLVLLIGLCLLYQQMLKSHQMLYEII